ncbi:MAG: type II secretion system minor pseudopilin GspK [Limnobacter sp.]|nr:type II secretion system minor pseudopilin GspK [Limnobacter sp.]
MNSQRGAAVIMALFVVVLCTLVVGPLIWTLFATAKSISVSAARDQTQEVALSGLDWARVILREDARVSTFDALTEPWAVPLSESRLNEGLMRRGESASNLQDRDTSITGRIEDAQGRFNLRNLGEDSLQLQEWTAAFNRLCTLLGVAQSDVETIQTVLGSMFTKNTESGLLNEPGVIQPIVPKIPVEVPAQQWAEFRGQYNLSDEAWQQLAPYVVILPKPTLVNVNTASAEVVYASIEGLSFADAQGIVSYRERVAYKELSDLRAAVNVNTEQNNALIDVTSQYFLVEGRAQVQEAIVKTSALLQRKDLRVYVLWRHD